MQSQFTNIDKLLSDQMETNRQICAMEEVNGCRNFVHQHSHAALRLIDIKPVHLIFHREILTLNRAESAILLNLQDSKYSNAEFCVHCLQTYIYSDFKIMLEHIKYMKCTYCKQCKPDNKFMVSPQNIREFSIFYAEDVTNRMKELSDSCTECKHLRTIIRNREEIELILKQLNRAPNMPDSQELRDRIAAITQTINELYSANQCQDKCKIEIDCLYDQLQNISYQKRLYNHFDSHETRINRCKRYVYNIFDPISGHIAPCKQCFSKMITVKKNYRRIKPFSMLPFDNVDDTPFYINSKRAFATSKTVKRILDENYTKQRQPIKSLISLCALKLQPNDIKEIINNYGLSQDCKIQLYKNY